MFQGNYKDISKKCKRCFKDIIMLFQGCFKEVLKVIQGILNSVSRYLDWCFKGDSRAFYGCFKFYGCYQKVSRVFGESFKKCSKNVSKVECLMDVSKRLQECFLSVSKVLKVSSSISKVLPRIFESV